MPSGAKRRKAAKKKQEKIAHIITENQQGNNGGDSSRIHDEKDSDSSSVSSSPRNLSRNTDDDDKSDDGRDRDVSTAGSASDEPRDKEKSQFHDEVEVTKEVDFESRVVDIDDVKESNGEDCSNGGIEKKIDQVVVPKKAAEESAVSVIESPSTKEVVEVVSQPVGVIVAVEIDVQSDDRELLQSNGTSVDTVNGSGDTVQPRISTSSDNETKDVFPVPPTVQPTSWKSCCGLFEVFGGSNR
ncbi:hypothetical protein ACHQM5_006534 [Ranunculus cassubicifolius]